VRMGAPDRIRDVVTVVAIASGCALAWLSVRVPHVMSKWWFWSAIVGLVVLVVELTIAQPKPRQSRVKRWHLWPVVLARCPGNRRLCPPVPLQRA